MQQFIPKNSHYLEKESNYFSKSFLVSSSLLHELNKPKQEQQFFQWMSRSTKIDERKRLIYCASLVKLGVCSVFQLANLVSRLSYLSCPFPFIGKHCFDNSWTFLFTCRWRTFPTFWLPSAWMSQMRTKLHWRFEIWVSATCPSETSKLRRPWKASCSHWPNHPRKGVVLSKY